MNWVGLLHIDDVYMGYHISSRSFELEVDTVERSSCGGLIIVDGKTFADPQQTPALFLWWT